jgi:hypothetical protein
VRMCKWSCRSAVCVVLLAVGAAHADLQIPLNCNFNGMVNYTSGSPTNDWGGWGGVADVLDGYRSISDRGLVVDGASHWGWNYNSYTGWEWGYWPSFGTDPLIGATGLTYSIVQAGHAVDIVMLGNRNTVDVGGSGGAAFDPEVDDDNIGVQPTWLPDPDQSGPQATTITPTIPISASSTVGVLYNISNGGGTFEVVFGFSDSSSMTVSLDGPDWFGSQDEWYDYYEPNDPTVTYVGRFGLFAGVGDVDNPYTSDVLNVAESVISLSGQAGKQLASITIQNRTNELADYAVYAATLDSTQILLNYNFNGMVNYASGSPTNDWGGWAGVADVSDGYRSISDRALVIDGASHWGWNYNSYTGWEWGYWPSFGTDPLIGATGLTYSIVQAGHAVDIVMLGNRNTVNGGAFFFDSAPDDDNVGIQPAWLPDPNQAPPTTTLAPPLPTIGDNSTLGALYNISDGGGGFEVLLGFGDGSSMTVTLDGPDWFGSQDEWYDYCEPNDPAVTYVGRFGLFAGVGNVDNPYADVALNVAESVVSLGTQAGKTLASITLQNRSNENADYAVYAVTVVPAGPVGDVDGDGDVDLADLATLLGAYGACEGEPDYNAAADFDDSGCVDLADLATLLGHYGESA